MEVASVYLETLDNVCIIIMTVLKRIRCFVYLMYLVQGARVKSKSYHVQLYLSVTTILSAVKRKQSTRELECCCFIFL